MGEKISVTGMKFLSQEQISYFSQKNLNKKENV